MQQFKRTYKAQNATQKIATVIGCLFICAYFLQVYLEQILFIEDVREYKNNFPYFLDRYRFLILSFSLIRERIMFNNSLNSYETEPQYWHWIDRYYQD